MAGELWMQLSNSTDSVIAKKEDKIKGTIDSITFRAGTTWTNELLGQVVEAINVLIEDHNYKLENEL